MVRKKSMTQEEFDFFFEMADTAFMYVDESMKIVKVNENSARLVDYPKEELEKKMHRADHLK